MKWAVAIITAPREPSWLPFTVESLARAGWREIAVCAEPRTDIPPNLHAAQVLVNPQRLGPHLSFRTALARLVRENPDAEVYAVFQDDVEVTENLRWWLETEGLWPSEKVGVLSLYTASVNHRDPPGWHACDKLPKGACGALAYVFPPESARGYLSLPPPRNTWGQQDFWVGWWCREAGLEYWMHSPSFVRHLGEVSSITDRGLDEYRQCRQFLERIPLSSAG